MTTFAETRLKSPPRKTLVSREGLNVPLPSTLVFAQREERSQLDNEFLAKFVNGSREIHEDQEFGGMIDYAFGPDRVSLRSARDLSLWESQIKDGPVYIDITGLSHQVWMPILRALTKRNRQVYCIYSEPEFYTESPNPRPGDFYNLSERTRGLFPIPSFAKLPSRTADSPILVPLLGFEGPRFRFLVESIEPNEKDIHPVIGVPGFEIDYPFHTFEGNSQVLSDTRSWQRAIYVDAACPFALYDALVELRKRRAGRSLQLAAIGTKPHALGAALFAMANDDCEILHDHPIRKKGRTSGTSKCHVYFVTEFMNSGQ